MRLYIGLIHYPVYNRNRKEIASAVTTLDIHDLSRLARTYGVKRFFLVTPLEDQQKLAERIIRHWVEGYGAEYNRDRKEALELAVVSPSIETSMGDIVELEGEGPLLISTDASFQEKGRITYSGVSELLISGKVIFLIFGTAWGLTKEVMDRSNYVLDPIEGRTGYNHLSVRTAAAIVLDRLTGAYLEGANDCSPMP